MEYLIRRCAVEDLDALVLLCAKHAAYERAEYASEGKADKLRTAIFSEDAPLHCWVVEVGKNIVGYVTYTFDLSTWSAGYFLHLDCLYLEGHVRGIGIGEKIMQSLMLEARKHNCDNIQWQTPAFNEPAIRFYRRLGAVSKEKQRFTIPL